MYIVIPTPDNIDELMHDVWCITEASHHACDNGYIVFPMLDGLDD